MNFDKAFPKGKIDKLRLPRVSEKDKFDHDVNVYEQFDAKMNLEKKVEIEEKDKVKRKEEAEHKRTMRIRVNTPRPPRLIIDPSGRMKLIW